MQTDKYTHLIDRLIDIANKSLMDIKHGAIICKNGKAIATGFNCIVGNNTHHAECSVIRNYLRTQNIWLSNAEIDLLEGKQRFL